MVGKINRRRVRKRRRPGENSKMKFVVICGIMVIAVLLGYLTARFVIGPLLGYDADESPISIAGSQDEAGGQDESSEEGGEGDEAGAEQAEQTASLPEDGYALQFGVFSTKDAAEELSAGLTAKGIETEIVEAEGKYKVIGPVLSTKDEALDALEDVAGKDVEDVFIASF